VDTRGSREIADPCGAVAELPDAAKLCASLLKARAKTNDELATLREKVGGARLPEDSCLVQFGSWGRRELTGESDNDWGLLLGDPDLSLEGPRVNDALEDLREVFDQGQSPGRQAYFGCAFHASPLSDRIGLDEDDTRNLTRRMLLLLESVPVTGEATHRRARDRVLERYLEYHRTSFRPPRFLLNDVIRYWRTICVDFEGKTAQDRREGASKDKFVTRNAKLRTSRKMLYASGLLPALLCHFVREDEIEPFMRTQIDSVATDRVARAFLHLNQRDAGSRVLTAYSDWIALMGDAKKRKELDGLDKKSRRESRTFKEVQRIGDVLDNGLAALLFETALSEVSMKYAVL
jgi:Putative nucleotidyltransferase DUF294